MTEADIQNILVQIDAGMQDRGTVYTCCGQSFASLFEFRKHLFEEHPGEYSLYFENRLHREQPTLPTKEELHKMVNRAKRKKEKERRRKGKKSRDAYPTPAKGDHFRIIYTPMGNKK